MFKFNSSNGLIVPFILIITMLLTRYLGNYLIFHAFAELFSIFVALSIAFVTYYTYNLTKDRYLLFIGFGYLWIGLLDILHTQTYPGMHIYDVEGMNTTLTLWILTRLFEAMIFLLAPIMRYREFSTKKVIAIFLSYSIFIVLLAMISPLALFDQESGLSTLKITSEYLIMLILLVALKLNSMQKNKFNLEIYKAIQTAIIFTIISEALFTLYTDSYGFSNLLGHVFKFLSFWVLLVSIVKISLKEPQKRLNDLNERMELALLGNHDGIWDWNLLTNEIYFSPRWKEMLGYSDSELANNFSTWKDRVHFDDLEIAMQGIQDNIDGKTDDYEGTHRLKHKDGSWVWILDRGKTIYDKDSKAIRMIGTHTDITAEKVLQLKYMQQAQVIQQIHDSVNTTDMNGIITSWNSASQKMFGYSADEMIGKHISILHLKKNLSIFPEAEKVLMQTNEFRIDIELRTKSENIIFVSLTLSLLKDENGKPTHIVGYAQDITERKRAEHELKEQKNILDHQAHHDALTGLPNRVLFNDRLTQAIQKAKRNSSKIALLFIDLDHFKEINDSLGHNVGDEILKIVTSRLKEITRDEDTLARLGGDEFTVILEDLTQSQDASLIASKILETLSNVIDINDNYLYVSSSIGISIYPDDGKDTQSLLKFSDSAMYKAKDEGRNNFQYYSSEMTELAFQRVVMEASLRAGIENEEFVVYYQPQVNGITDELIGMEALVRWNHPTMGLVSPAKFIPLAESTGLIIELDKFVMKSAMTQIAQWYKEGLNPGTLAMNLSVKQLQQKDFIHMFKNLIQEAGCTAEYLELEVTEGQIMTHPEEAIKILQGISNIGVKLAVDDFGTGYSSLAYLKKLPINKLKIDQAFVSDLPDDEEDAAITKAVIALAKSLNLNIIAEGVETKEQKSFIVENGCKNIQGYFYSKPVPAQEIQAMLIKQKNRDGLN